MKKIAKISIIFLCIIVFLILCLFVYVGIIISQTEGGTNLNLAKLNNYQAQVKIYDKNEEEFVTTSTKGNNVISLQDLPEYTPQCFISIEDKRFYEHNGINLGRIMKACVKNIFSGYAKEGASTITQQLIKNTHLNSEKTMSRKIQEAYLAIKLEQQYSKQEILETYLNVIYFGNSSYGIENATQNYFGHSAKNLTLAESATLAGLIKSPKRYSPIFNKENCIARRNLVLKNMLDDNKISQTEYENAINEPLNALNQTNSLEIFNKVVLDEAMQILNLSETDVSTKGYKIYTYIDKSLQNELKKNIENSDIENAIIAIDNKTNGVVAYLGNCEQNRQIGSTIKPILCYAPAFEMNKLSPITPINDEKTDFNGYTPKNASGNFAGWVSTRQALAKSLNIPAIKTLEYNTIPKSIEYAKKFGLHFTDNDNHLAIALGATQFGENLQIIANAYATFARNGKYATLNFIKRIETNNGTILYQNKDTYQQIIGEDTAYMINDILKDTITYGTARKLSNLGIPLSAKTGTVGTNNGSNTDAWCISYNPQFTVGVWYGNTKDAQDNLTSSQNGGTIASNLNKNVWQEIIKKYQVKEDFIQPESVEKLRLDSISLSSQKIELASPETPEMYTVCDIFAKRYAPTTTSKNFSQITVPVLSLSNNNPLLSLSWEGLDYLNYALIKEENGETEILHEFEGKNERFTFEIPIPAENCSFYLRVSYKTSKNEQIANSNIVKFQPTTKTKLDTNSVKSIAKKWHL